MSDLTVAVAKELAKIADCFDQGDTAMALLKADFKNNGVSKLGLDVSTRFLEEQLEMYRRRCANGLRSDVGILRIALEPFKFDPPKGHPFGTHYIGAIVDAHYNGRYEG